MFLTHKEPTMIQRREVGFSLAVGVSISSIKSHHQDNLSGFDEARRHLLSFFLICKGKSGSNPQHTHTPYKRKQGPKSRTRLNAIPGVRGPAAAKIYFVSRNLPFRQLLV